MAFGILRLTFFFLHQYLSSFRTDSYTDGSIYSEKKMHWGLPFEKGHSNYPGRISYSTTRKSEPQEGPESQGEGLKWLFVHWAGHSLSNHP